RRWRDARATNDRRRGICHNRRQTVGRGERNMIRWALGTMAMCLAWAAYADDFKERHPDTRFEPLLHNNPGLVVDLGVGLWAYPLPADVDGDGDVDLRVATPDKPSNGVYYFENVGPSLDEPFFKPGKWLRPADGNM